MTRLISSWTDSIYLFLPISSEKPNVAPPMPQIILLGKKLPKMPMDGCFLCASGSVRALVCGAAPSLLGCSGEGCCFPPVSKQTAFVLSVREHQDKDPEKSLGCRWFPVLNVDKPGEFFYCGLSFSSLYSSLLLFRISYFFSLELPKVTKTTPDSWKMPLWMFSPELFR